MYRWFPLGGRWLSQAPDVQHSAAVLCLAPAGHGPAPFARWPGSVGAVGVTKLQLPGDWNARWWQDHSTFEAQADDLVSELNVHIGMKFALFAHGSSALIAYEAAVRLAGLGQSGPCRLIVSGCPAPTQAREQAPEPTEEELSVRALRIFSELSSNPLPSLVEMSVRALRAEACALRAYKSDGNPRLGIPITVVGWRQDTGVQPAAMTEWQQCGPATPVELDGTQFSYSRAPSGLMRILADDNAIGGAD